MIRSWWWLAMQRNGWRSIQFRQSRQHFTLQDTFFVFFLFKFLLYFLDLTFPKENPIFPHRIFFLLSTFIWPRWTCDTLFLFLVFFFFFDADDPPTNPQFSTPFKSRCTKFLATLSGSIIVRVSDPTTSKLRTRPGKRHKVGSIGLEKKQPSIFLYFFFENIVQDRVIIV